MSEVLILASTNPQYDDRLYIVHANGKLRIPDVYTNCCFCFVLTFRTILVHNMFCRCCELLKKIYLYQSFIHNIYSVQPESNTKRIARVKPSQYIAPHLYEQKCKSNCSSCSSQTSYLSGSKIFTLHSLVAMELTDLPKYGVPGSYVPTPDSMSCQKYSIVT